MPKGPLLCHRTRRSRHLLAVKLNESRAQDREAIVCFESAGGQEWQLWARREAEGVAARQPPPAQVKAFAQSLGTRAKTDRIDAELVACFFARQPEASRSIPAEKLRRLRTLRSKRAQRVEMRKRLLAQVRAHQKTGHRRDVRGHRRRP